MEGLSPVHRRVAGIDVHRMLHVVTVLIEQPDGSMARHRREFGGFKRDCRALVRGLIEGQSPAPLLSHARGALERKTEDPAATNKSLMLRKSHKKAIDKWPADSAPAATAAT